MLERSWVARYPRGGHEFDSNGIHDGVGGRPWSCDSNQDLATGCCFVVRRYTLSAVAWLGRDRTGLQDRSRVTCRWLQQESMTEEVTSLPPIMYILREERVLAVRFSRLSINLLRWTPSSFGILLVFLYRKYFSITLMLNNFSYGAKFTIVTLLTLINIFCFQFR